MTEYTHNAALEKGLTGQQRFHHLASFEKHSAPGPSERMEDKSSARKRYPGRILFAEDEEIIRTLTVKLLERAGYEVLVAPDGVIAKEIFDNINGDVDLVLLDVVMPNADGHEVYDFIKSKNPNMPVLFSTGYGLNSTYTKFIAIEGLAVLRKPYSPSALVDKIQEMLSERH